MSQYRPNAELLQHLDNSVTKIGMGRVRETCKYFLMRKTVGGGGTVRKRIPRPWVKDAFGKQNAICPRCRNEMKLSDAVGDHRIALAQGGKNDKRNIQALHSWCNSEKGANDLTKEAKLTGSTVLEQLGGDSGA